MPQSEYRPSPQTRRRQVILTVCLFFFIMSTGMAIENAFGARGYFILGAAISFVVGVTVGFRMILRGE